jgi:hypothetical protein
LEVGRNKPSNLKIVLQEGSADIECRYDWHQTATHVVVAIYCKNYHPDTSFVEVSPVRFRVHVYFPEQAGAFNLDLELAGVSSKILLKIVFENLICSLIFIRR